MVLRHPIIRAQIFAGSATNIPLYIVATQSHINLRFSGAKIRTLWVVAALILSLIPGFATSQSNLPSMGEPADNALSPLEEQAIGRQLMRQIRTGLPLMRDTQLNEYIDTLGQQLVQASGRQNTPFHFFIVRDAGINAFAIPGGYIGVNVGLINAMKFEDQLAGVLAHEIAHVTQRHHARMFPDRPGIA